jgi:hypothetical protein
MKVTFFQSLVDTNTPHIKSINYALSRIKSGKSKELCDRIRKGDGDVASLKKQLPCVLFSGQFSSRSAAGLIKHSGFIVLDFDKEEIPEDKKQELSESPFVFSAWISPSGSGVKALIKIGEHDHLRAFNALSKFFSNVDPSGKDVSRICFESYDPDIYVNEESEVFDPSIMDVKPQGRMEVKKWGPVNQALGKIEQALDGEKHNVLLRISHLFGGWVGSKDIAEHDAITLLENAIRKKPIKSFSQAQKTIRDGIDKGKSKPLHIKEQQDILNMSVGLGRLYVQAADIWEDIKKFAENGYEKGDPMGWSSVDARYSLISGSTTYVYGAPDNGKSQIWHEILIGQAERYGKRIAMMSPETGSVSQIYAELASIKMGCSLDKELVPDFNQKAFMDALHFVAKHFIVIDPADKSLKVRDFYDQVKAIEREFNIHVDITCIDPFNVIDTDYDAGRHDKKLGKDLDYMIYDARLNDRHNSMITHTRDQQIMSTSGDLKQYYFPKPTPRDVYDGQQFYRKGMGMLAVWRPIDVNGDPLRDRDGIPYERNTTILDWQKTKPKGVGQKGESILYYDKLKNCYYEMPFHGNDALGNKYYRFQYSDFKKN